MVFPDPTGPPIPTRIRVFGFIECLQERKSLAEHLSCCIETVSNNGAKEPIFSIDTPSDSSMTDPRP